MKNPLIKRLPRELIGEFPKYIVIFLFMTLTIGFISGFLVAGNSMIIAYDESFEKYNIEDGHVEFEEEADDSMMEEVEKEENVTFYKDFYKEAASVLKKDNSQGTMRVFQPRETVNKICLMEGTMPKKKNQVAIDRMHADNNNWKIGDKITLDGKEYDICGLVALSDYSALYSDNNDFMFDAVKFGVAVMSKEGYETLSEDKEHFQYDWVYADKPQTEKEKNDKAEDFMTAIAKKAYNKNLTIKNFIPEYANQAIRFTGEDMGGDRAMMIGLLYILIAIIAFIFSITIKHTIIRESSVIGTLRASGYTRGEVLRHYLAVPIMVTLISSLLGNVLGYTVFKDMVADLYYGSYSLPTYETIWNPDAFFKTTLIPVVLMFMVNLIVIIKMMQHTPLQFLRHDLKKTKRKKAMRLPHFKFFNRFRLRIMFQNVANYLILFVGIFFIMVMLAMAVGMPDTLSYYKENAKNMMFAKYQYVLKSFEDEDGNVLTTDNKDAEKFSMCSLQKKSDVIDEEVSVYGISDDSKYVEIKGMQSLQEDEVYISRSFSEKYELNVGDTVSLDEKYENKQYTFTVAGIYDQCVNIAVFMPIENYRMVFELDEEAFSGYFSNEELADLSEDDIATVITERDITKMCDQLDHSMGSYMDYFQILCILLSAVLIYLLTKLIIEKNENAISMTKILGYENKEIASLYLLSTTIMVVIEDAVSVVLGAFVMNLAWKAILFSYSGWFAFVIQPAGYVKMFAFVLIGYLFVMILDFMRIKKIPMDQALKNVE